MYVMGLTWKVALIPSTKMPQIIIVNSKILSVRISFPLLNNLAEADYMHGI